jgi:phosphatidylserine decarboxylase
MTKKPKIQKKSFNRMVLLSPVLARFKRWISTHLKAELVRMIDETNNFVRAALPRTRRQISQLGDWLELPDFDRFFEVLDSIVHRSPAFDPKQPMLQVPLNAFWAVAMGTRAGGVLFQNAEFNAQLKKVLNEWNRFLKSPASLSNLDILRPERRGSWISREAHAAGVWTDVVFDPAQQGYGFASWNDFFIRRFRPGARPFRGPFKSQVHVACETISWNYAENLCLESQFWVKSYMYSLADMFGHKAGQWAGTFVGGTLYQGFLSASMYHRWHCPLTGLLLRSWVEPGTYFSQRPGQGQGPGTWDGTETQPYLAQVSSRAIFVFKHELLGHVAVICIGMVEVSTCWIEPEFLVGEKLEPIPVSRGQEIGHFEFGGSSLVMLFEKHVALAAWVHNAREHNHIKLGQVIASS